MARTVQFTVPPAQTDDLLARIERLEILGLRVERGISLRPPGDVVTVETTNRNLPRLLSLADAAGIGVLPGTCIATSEPASLVSASSADQIARDPSLASWEEMESELAKESNATADTMLVMALAGLIAAIGIATNALHVVIGAMIIAPAFEPVTRSALGIAAGGRAWRDGLRDVARGYGSLFLGALGASLVLRLLDVPPLTGEASYLARGALLSYWLSITAPAALVSAAAAVAGGILVCNNRSVLTAGVLIALALVPSVTIAGMALAVGEPAVAGRAALRWAIDTGLVFLLSLAVFAWKRRFVDRRKRAG